MPAMPASLAIGRILAAFAFACCVAGLRAAEPVLGPGERAALDESRRIAVRSPEEAAAYLDARPALDKGGALAFASGVLRLQAGDAEGAGRAFAVALERNPAFDRARRMRAAVLLRLGRGAEAHAVLAPLFAEGAAVPDAATQALDARAQLLAGDSAAAERRLADALAKHPSEGGLLRMKLELHLAGARWAEAAALADDLLRGAPSDTFLWQARIRAAEGLGDADGASAALAVARRLGLMEPGPVVAAPVGRPRNPRVADLLRAAADAADPADPEALLRRALALAPADGEVLMALADALLRKGTGGRDEAASLLRQAACLPPCRDEAVRRIWHLLLASGDGARARAFAREAGRPDLEALCDLHLGPAEARP